MFCFSVVYENAAILFGCEAPEMWLSISSSGGDDEHIVLFGWVTVALRITLSNYDFLNQVWTLKLNLLWPLIHPDFRSVRHNWSFWFTCPWALVDLLHEHEEDRRATGEKKKKKTIPHFSCLDADVNNYLPKSAHHVCSERPRTQTFHLTHHLEERLR